MIALLRFLGFEPNPVQRIDELWFGLSWGWASLVLLSLCTFPCFYFFYRMERKPCPPALRRLLLSLRMAFVLGILILLAGARLSISGWIPQKNQLAVLLDTSRSMSIREEGKTRIDRVRDALTKDQLIQKIEQQTAIAPALFSFAESVAPLTHADLASFSLTAEGNYTDLSWAVRDVISHLGEGSLLGIVMVTDGAWNQGENPLSSLQRLQTPLYFLGTGKTELTHDLAISLEQPPAIGYLNAQIRVRGEIKLHRIATESVKVVVQKDGKYFQTIDVPIEAGHSQARFALNLACDQEGSFAYSVQVPQLDNELTYDNNETGFLLKVIKERLNILLISGVPSWEQTFLKAAALSDPNAHITAWTMIRENRWLHLRDGKLQAPQNRPDFALELNDTDVLVLKDVPESVLKPAFSPIRERIEQGRMGLLLLPGRQSYTALGYGGSPLLDLFPITLSGEEWRGTPSNMLLPSQEPPYTFLRLLDDPIENLDFFRLIPKLDGMFIYGKRKLGTEVLLSSTLETVDGAAPALLAHRVGHGQVAMLTGGPLWPMGFRLVTSEHTIKPFTAFTLNLLKWLANRREDAQVAIELASTRGFVGQPLRVRVWVTDARRMAIANAQVQATLTDALQRNTELTCLASSEKGCYEVSYVPAHRGLLKIEANARLAGQHLGKSQAEVLVQLPTAEFDNPEVQTELMIQLASSTGGLYRPLEEAAELVRNIRSTPGQKRQTKVFELRDSWFLLAILLLLPLSEWVLRRTKGYN